MNYNDDMVMKAYIFAQKAHEGQYREDEKTPYFTHPYMVKRLMERDKYSKFHQIVALLHDVVEDTNITFEEIEEKFGKKVTKVLKFLTKHPLENYHDYIIRLVKNRYARDVKWYDLSHNMSDLREGSLKDKYRFATLIIEMASSLEFQSLLWRFSR